MNKHEAKGQQYLSPPVVKLGPHSDPIEVGQYGEQLAARYLTDAGYVILDRNWRCRAGELDLVAQQGRITVICEVRTRRGHRAGSGLESVTRRKLRRLRRLAGEWQIETQNGGNSIRIDVIGIQVHTDNTSTIHHVRGAV